MSLQGGCLRCLHRTIHRPSPEKPEAKKKYVQFTSVHSVVSNSLRPHKCRMPGLPVHHQHTEFTQIHVHWVINAIQPSHPLSYPFPPTFNLSQHQGLFQSVNSSHQVAKVLEFQLHTSPYNEYSELISFRMDWLDLLAVQGTQEFSPTPQFKSINSLALSFLYSPTLTSIHKYWKNHSLARQIFVGKVMSLLFNMLSWLVTTFLPRHKHLLISWLQSVILEPKKIVCHYFHCFPIYFPWSDGTRCHDLSFLNVEL